MDIKEVVGASSEEWIPVGLGRPQTGVDSFEQLVEDEIYNVIA